MSKTDKKILFESSKAVLIHRIGNLAINQTDSIIVATFIDVSSWGLMGNYLLIRKSAQMLGDSLYAGILPSMGNLVATQDKRKHIDVFLKYDFLNFIFYTFCFVMMGMLATPFVSLLFGNKYVVDNLTVFFMLLAFFIDGLRNPVSSLRESSGNFIKDRWFTSLAAIVNLIISVGLVGRYKIIGIYIGTISAMIVLHILRSVTLFGKTYDYSSFQYLLKIAIHIIYGCSVYFIIFLITKSVIGENINVNSFVFKGLIALLLFIIITYVTFRRNKYMDEIIQELLTKVKKGIKR